ncbi:hypothetical protein PHYSODRAFT_249774 [Phytophthora sojae]|uniref:Uncharacterized protein n=1 Tax=Phytophthora sojae (strain P6497) TaxID=1094619 RepID=G5AI20_PHYSP|nr:hypothetical protein PHYSODRAFT_249774 [Phytophthora sojae]EGZ04849.1 hypothetical protein PHYSODRAFT_249774 [Phytophthora sojae]|eukprot:XP_009539691.1 hypothetical protein PHYSODRAFT_249774 [Phytophthora sojae]
MDSDHAMEDAPAHFAQQISAAEYERQAVEFTTQEVERLNAAVRAQPELGARSEFFQDEENVAKGLPVFQGKHTRFVYDDEDDEIVAAVDVTQAALNSGPVVRTVAQLDADLEDDDEEEGEEYEEGEDGEEYYEEEEHDEAVQNHFYTAPDEGHVAMDDAHVNALMEDVEMEMAAVAIDEDKLLAAAAQRQ